MTQTPEDAPRPTPRPRPAAAARPSPRPRVAGSRRDREEPGVDRPAATGDAPPRATSDRPAGASPASARRGGAPRGAAATAAAGRRVSALVVVLALLCAFAAVGVGVLLWQRMEPRYVDGSVLDAARENVQALYAYDYEDSEGSIEGKLEVLTGDLRDQYEQDLSQGGIVDTYEQVSATTRYEVNDVGLQLINEAQDVATVVVFGQYVAQSVNSGDQPAPEGSECQITPEGAQSCVQTVRLDMRLVDGEWKISDLLIVTTS